MPERASNKMKGPCEAPIPGPARLTPVCVRLVWCMQDFERLLQDVNRTTMKAIQVYVDQVRGGQGVGAV